MGFLDMLRPKFGKKEAPPSASAPAVRNAGESPVARIPEAGAGTVASTSAKTYTVKAGDTLSKIAKSELGDASKYTVLFEANRDVLKDADKIYPGQVLKIPQGGSQQLH